MAVEKNQKDTINEIKQVEKRKKEMMEEDRKQYEKDYKKALEHDLYMKIYVQFENNLEEFSEQIPQDKAIDILYNCLMLRDIKTIAIDETADNTSDKEYLQTKYKNIINNIKTEFLDDYNARYNIDPDFREKQNEIRKKIYTNNQNTNIEKNSIEYIKTKINAFLTFSILSLGCFGVAYLIRNTIFSFMNLTFIPRGYFLWSVCDLFLIY